METKPLSTYDPQFDPLYDAGPGHGRAYAPTYWIDTLGEKPQDDGPITGDIDADVVIIGAGYTGLSCAIHLAKDYGIKACVVDANQVAFGCSTRNGGQAQSNLGRLSRQQWIDRWGLDTAKKINREVDEAFDVFSNLIKDFNIDCDAHYEGHYYIAHRPHKMKGIQATSDLMNVQFGYNTRVLSACELRNDVVNDHEAYGALFEPQAISIHAGKLAMGYLKIARNLGAKVHSSSPITGWKHRDGVHYLTTPNGIVKSRQVAVAGAGYLNRTLHPKTKDRLFPILSNVIVTRALSKTELQTAGIKTKGALTDSRVLRNYYRLLPDNRLQMGSRSAISGKKSTEKKYERLLKNTIARKFPDLAGIDIEYSWWGWVDVSHDMMPRITKPNVDEEMYYAMGYGGNGVMYSAQAGRRMAQMIAGDDLQLDLPIFTTQLEHKGILTPFRRLGQQFLYGWYWLNDEYLSIR